MPSILLRTVWLERFALHFSQLAWPLDPFSCGQVAFGAYPFAGNLTPEIAAEALHSKMTDGGKGVPPKSEWIFQFAMVFSASVNGLKFEQAMEAARLAYSEVLNLPPKLMATLCIQQLERESD